MRQRPFWFHSANGTREEPPCSSKKKKFSIDCGVHLSDPGWISHGFEVDQEQEIGEKYEITKNSEELVYMVYVCKGIVVLIITNIWLNS